MNRIRRLFLPGHSELVLSDILSQDAHSVPLHEQMHVVGRIIHWIFRAGPKSVDARCRFLIQSLEKNEAWRGHFLASLDAVLRGGEFLPLLTQAELAIEHGLWGDAFSRLTQRLLPVGGNVDFRRMLLDALGDEKRVAGLGAVSEGTLARLAKLVYRDDNAAAWADLRRETGEALLFLSAHVAHLGLSGEVRRRAGRAERVSESPFVRLEFEVLSGRPERIQSGLARCREAVERVYEDLEQSGVSVDTVNRLETVSGLLEQIERVAQLNESTSLQARPGQIVEFLRHAALTGLRSREVFGHVRRHFFLLAKKIAERNGVSGEHYIARDRSELVSLFYSSVGGGVIVVGMTIFKLLVIQAKPAPLFLASALWVIYSAGFLLMQFTGATLATKIPSFTASRLATLLLKVRRNNPGEFRSELREVLRSQSLSLLGNVVGLVPLVLALGYLASLVSWIDVSIPEPYARHILDELHPFMTWAIPFAALTGAELWLSSLGGGWFENWIVFNRVPEAIRYHSRLHQLFGEAACTRVADWASHNASGIAANLALGFLFGFVPLAGTLLGLDWSGHHVTIASTSAMLAAVSVHFSIAWQDTIWIVLGLLCIGLMNFAVSFGIALYVAAGAQKMKFWRVLRYLRGDLAPEDGEPRNALRGAK